ncbi:uncharacterized protein YjbI with pentapeptide repeats [Saccharothrix tamanrassetensis]|uniref:Uncharacterized protein YjbI with pentapeptide repeats n=1 Tax=Saccharothrix tamanrassetensis TaxID=1051531 RepID=A0A841CKY1_9PSEU|nr:pentapeptide repeat-containing protein [Saccharothrix tamanrassetensis]MBB5957024.1 uncharacterized protein YjbI with pentapeptide repeats [Saccharothrix tamanrassetensis]
MTTGEIPAAELVGGDVDVVDAHVTGVLELPDAAPRTLRFTRCRFDRPPVLREAAVRRLEFDDCELPGLDARRLGCRGDLVLTRSSVHGPVELGDAAVGGEVSLRHSRIATLRANRLTVGGDLCLAGAVLDGADGVALDGRGMRIGGGVLGEDDDHIGATATGAVVLADARIGGAVSLRQARLADLVADRARLTGDVDLTEARLRSLCLVGATVGGSLVLGAMEVDEEALALDRVRVAGDVHLAFALVKAGVRLVDGWIGGDLRASRVELGGMSGARVHVTGDVDLGQARSDDGVRLPGMEVGGQVDLSGAALHGPGGVALDLREARVGDELRLADMAAEGTVDLSGATVRGRVELRGAHLGARAVALAACRLVTGELGLAVEDAPQGRVDLRYARCASLHDNRFLWSAGGGVELAGFDYLRLEPRLEDRTAVRRRLALLRDATRRFTPDAYDRLAAVLRSDGQEVDADTVLVEKQRLRYAERARAVGWAGPAVTAWSVLMRSLTGYGYRMWRGISVLLLVALVVFLVW